MIPWQNHLGAKVWSFITLMKFIASCVWVDERVSSQKFGICPSQGISTCPTSSELHLFPQQLYFPILVFGY